MLLNQGCNLFILYTFYVVPSTLIICAVLFFLLTFLFYFVFFACFLIHVEATVLFCRPIKNFDEVPYHFISVIHTFVEMCKMSNDPRVIAQRAAEASFEIDSHVVISVLSSELARLFSSSSVLHSCSSFFFWLFVLIPHLISW
jgi:hypothetical protein